MAKPIRRARPLEKAVLAASEELGILAGGAVVVAVSGGPDSMALLHALVRLARAGGDAPTRVVAAHFDHRLRGEASDADAAFVAEAADRLGIALEAGAADVRADAARARRNVEAVARDLRYAFLADAARRAGAPAVATAHTADDQAETVLMRLARGAGVDGLAAVAPRLELAPGVRLVRPMLAVTRADVLAYCRSADIDYRTDATNFDTDLTRAFVRHELLPRLDRVAPGAASRLARTARLARDDAEYFAAEVAALLDAWGVDAGPGGAELPADALGGLPAAIRRRVVREVIRRVKGDLRRVDARHVEAVDGLAGPGRAAGEVALPDGLRARRRGGAVRVERSGRNCVEKGPTGS